MKIFEKILTREEFQSEPPVLLDIGASGEMHKNWKEIAKYSICIAFDADEREMGYIVKESSGYKKLYAYNAVVTDKNVNKIDFYLTKSPYCSSSLLSDAKNLKDWAYNDLFTLEKMVSLNAVTLKKVLDELNIKNIDWFKIDSQGTDLRLFNSLNESLRNKVLTCDFEPGLINAYQGEDKLWSLLQYMEDKPFWISNLNVLGAQRINEAARKSLNEKMILREVIPISPGWVEISYLNTLKNERIFTQRDYLLMWVIATMKKQCGFALEISIKGKTRFSDPIFIELENYTKKKMHEIYRYNLRVNRIIKFIRKPINLLKATVKNLLKIHSQILWIK